MRFPIFLVLFLIASLLHLWFEWIDFRPGILIVKPSLMTLLLIHFLRNGNLGKPWIKWMAVGIFFSIGGDTFLMFVEQNKQGELFFILGLGAFLITHICYAIGLWNANQQQWSYQGVRWFWVVGFLAYLGVFYSLLWPGMEAPLQAPVGIYSLCIVVMVLMAQQLRWGAVPDAGLTIYLGALLFMVSDSLIGLNKFSELPWPTPYIRVGIMATYLLGQFLIARGSIQFTKEA